MTEILIGALAGVSVAVLGAYAVRSGDKEERAREVLEMEEGEAAIAEALREIEDGAAVRSALRSAWDSLRAQNAAGYSCWLSSCISRINDGEPVPREVALLALRYTRKEMAGPRFEKEGYPTVYFNLSGLDAAIASLEN